MVLIKICSHLRNRLREFFFERNLDFAKLIKLKKFAVMPEPALKYKSKSYF